MDHFGGRVAPIRTTKRSSADSEQNDARTMRPTEPAQRQAKLASLDKQVAQQHRDPQTLTAPVDGTVQQLAVHTVGGVVTPAQALMIVVPADSRLEIEAMIENKDIGFVAEGNPAEIKIETFNFTKYGLLHGTVMHLSRDTVAPDRADPGAADGRQQPPSQQTSQQEPVYTARISLERDSMEVDGHPIALGPGMAVTAEIKTGSRRIISYLLSPLMKYRQESLRER